MTIIDDLENTEKYKEEKRNRPDSTTQNESLNSELFTDIDYYVDFGLFINFHKNRFVLHSFKGYLLMTAQHSFLNKLTQLGKQNQQFFIQKFRNSTCGLAVGGSFSNRGLAYIFRKQGKWNHISRK